MVLGLPLSIPVMTRNFSMTLSRVLSSLVRSSPCPLSVLISSSGVSLFRFTLTDVMSLLLSFSGLVSSSWSSTQLSWSESSPQLSWSESSFEASQSESSPFGVSQIQSGSGPCHFRPSPAGGSFFRSSVSLLLHSRPLS